MLRLHLGRVVFCAEGEDHRLFVTVEVDLFPPKLDCRAVEGFFVGVVLSDHHAQKPFVNRADAKDCIELRRLSNWLLKLKTAAEVGR